ncbi:MAG: hypothetical protein LBE98_04300 [Puniceicoccales bacterium]|jgi:hypothetical protein|nr:hypothetical protein [Puniceicoccales bacterium]
MGAKIFVKILTFLLEPINFIPYQEIYFMSDIPPEPSPESSPEPPVAQSQGARRHVVSLNPKIVKVLKENFNFKVSETALGEHAVALESEPASPAPVPAAPDAEPAAPDIPFADLANELEAGRYEVGMFRKIWIWITNFVSGDYDVEVRKAAFEKIQKKENFVAAAFEFIALPENTGNVAENVRNLLIFCQTTDPNLIIDGFCAIPGGVDDKIEILSMIVEKFSAEEINISVKAFLEKLLSETLDKVTLAEDKDANALCERLENLQKLCDKCKEKRIFLENPRDTSSPNTKQIAIAAEKKLTEMLVTYVTNPNLRQKYQDALKTMVLLQHPYCQSDTSGIEVCPIGIQICQMVQMDEDPNNCLSTRLMEYFNCQGNPNQFRGKISPIQQILSEQDVNSLQRRANFIQFLKDNPDIRKAFQQMKDKFPPDSVFFPFEIFAYIFNFHGGDPFYNFVDESLQGVNSN